VQDSLTLIRPTVKGPVSEADENFVTRVPGMDGQGARNLRHSTRVLCRCMLKSVVEYCTQVVQHSCVLTQSLIGLNA